MLDTQSILTYTAEAFTFFYVCVTVFDFAAGLLTAWQNAGTKAQVPVEWEPVVEKPIAPQIEPTSTLLDPWTLPIEEQVIAQNQPQEVSIKPQLLLAPAPQKIATLQWVQENMPAAEIYAAQLPDAIAMTKARLSKVTPALVVEIASRQQLIAAGIRRCKQLARQIKLSGYSNMKLRDLAANLEGRVLLSELVA